VTRKRIDVLAPILSQYQRRFSVLDLGCGGGEISREIQLGYDAAVFSLDRECEALLQCEITTHGLEQLSSLEHFDVVIAFNFLHHFQDWERAARAVIEMGHHVFIQLPPRGDKRLSVETIDGLHEVIGFPPLDSIWYPSFSHHRPIWHIENPSTRTSGWGWEMEVDFNKITGTYDGYTKEWIPGMSLWNMHGLGADRAWLLSLVEGLSSPEKEHGDIQPWNMIWDGREVHLIDWQDEPNGHRFWEDPEGIADTIRRLRNEENTEFDVLTQRQIVE